MRRLMLALALLSGFAGLARAGDPDAAIRAVISDQIEAFQADDLERAFSHASPMIRQLFGSPARFGQMVQQGYPMIWRPSGLRFSGLSDQDGHKIQSVLITDQAGNLYIADYDMIPTGDGWQIDGVEVRQAEGTSA